MKVMTFLGTRPEIIRLSQVIPRLDEACDHLLVHTGQSWDPTLSQVFFDELGVRPPDLSCGVTGRSIMERVGAVLRAAEEALIAHRPDRVLILGDTESALAAFAAKRLGFPVFHMEAGNRSYDHRIPEETNRRTVDHCSDILMPYTENSRRNLLREGFPGERVYVTGNPILEALRRVEPRLASSEAMARLGLAPRRFLLATLHRAENVDVEPRLRLLHDGLARLAAALDRSVVVSCHPRTRKRLEAAGLGDSGDLRFIAPLGIVDFLALQRQAACVLTDSGTVQEECAIFRIPNVTLRDTTERPETVECGSNILAGADPERILAAARLAMAREPRWQPPAEYLIETVSDTVARIVTGHHENLPSPFGYRL